MMSKAIELSDEQYRTIELAAAARGQTPAALLARVIDDLRDPRTDPRHYETGEWFRHLGATDEQIVESTRRAADERSNADA